MKNFREVPEEYKDMKQVLLTEYGENYILLENGKVWSRVTGKFIKSYNNDTFRDKITLMHDNIVQNTTIGYLMRKHFKFEELFNNVKYKPVLGYENKYLALEDGRIYSLTQYKFMKPCITNTGWSIISVVNNNGKRETKYPAKMVYEAFNGPIKEGYRVTFKDNNKTNCKLQNLDVISKNI